MNTCRGCQSHNIVIADVDYVCIDCGLVADEQGPILTEYPSHTEHMPVTKRRGEVSKLHQWTMYTSQEKTRYKLSTYTRALCEKIGIENVLVDRVCDMVQDVMDVVTQLEGAKRARVKDGIVIACIHFVSKEYGYKVYDVGELGAKAGVQTKFITRAQTTVIELIQRGKLQLNPDVLLKTKMPMDFVMEAIQRNRLRIPSVVLKRVENVISACVENNVLANNTNLAIGATCFYYVLKEHNIEFDTKLFSEMYGITFATLNKTYNRLKQC